MPLTACPTCSGARPRARARLHKRMPADSALHVLQAVGDTGYLDSATLYLEVRAQLHLECLASLAMLMQAGKPEAVVPLDSLGGRAAVAALLGGREDVEPGLLVAATAGGIEKTGSKQA